MAESLLERSARFIDGSVYEGPRTINPIDGSFHEIADGLAMVCGFSHIWTLDTGDGLVVCDTSLPGYASLAVEHLRRWRPTPVGKIIYTHGHVDHVSGARTFLEDAEGQGHPAPEVVGHIAVGQRFDRYDMTLGYNEIINRRQFALDDMPGSFTGNWVRPEVTYNDNLDEQD